MEQWIAASILVVIGIAHSVLGETGVIKPLLASKEWHLPGIPRAAANPLLRFAWHLTTIAWWALAAVLVGASIEIAFAVTCLSAAALILALLPGHLAWPLFLTAGLLALGAGDAMPRWLMWTSVGLGVLVALVAAAFHVAWALGSRRGVANVIPQDPTTGEPTFRPRPVGTAAVAFALVAYSALVVLEGTSSDSSVVRWMVIAALTVLTARVFGDGRWTGVLKSVRGTGFARADDRYWTPAVATLALGAWAALALG